MQSHWASPGHVQWCQWLLNSYRHWIAQELIVRQGTLFEQAERLFQSEFVVASHGTESDPILNYGNQRALDLWEMDWQQFIQTPSRLTAEPAKREDRDRVLSQVRSQGYITNYSGIRITSTGRRFFAEQITVWNIQNPEGGIVGQAATFSNWKFLTGY